MASNSNAIADAIASSNAFRMPAGNRTTSRLSTWNMSAEGENTARRAAEAVLAMPQQRLNPHAAPFRPASRGAGAASRRRRSTRRNRRSSRRANRK
jgi:hypothetical protein